MCGFDKILQKVCIDCIVIVGVRVPLNIGADVWVALLFWPLQSNWLDMKIILIARNGITKELGEKALFSEIPDTRNT